MSRRLGWVEEALREDRARRDSSLHHAARARFLDAALAGRGPSGRPRHAIFAAFATAALVGAITFIAARRASPPVSVRALPAVLERSDPTRLELPDGSSFALSVGARGRLREVTPTSAVLVLERGSAAVDVVHRPGTSYHVLAGPYDVAVTGTTFDVSWEPDREELRVDMRSGVVHVTGPRLGAGRDVEAGTTFTAVATAADGVAPATTDNAPAPAQKETARPKSAPPSARRVDPAWRELVDRGAYDDVIKSAEAAALPSVLASRDDDDLSALADAARFTGRKPLARDTLLALRKRFPSSGRAHTAAFVLGKMDEDSGAIRDAAAWYDRYLAEAPDGALATEASGRALLAWKKAGAIPEARRAASVYLRRAPDGPHATVARETLGP